MIELEDNDEVIKLLNESKEEEELWYTGFNYMLQFNYTYFVFLFFLKLFAF